MVKSDCRVLRLPFLSAPEQMSLVASIDDLGNSLKLLLNEKKERRKSIEAVSTKKT